MEIKISNCALAGIMASGKYVHSTAVCHVGRPVDLPHGPIDNTKKN